MHCIWTLPEGDSGYSKRWGLIKAGFSQRARELFERSEWMSSSKTKHRESTIWQRRFWEHQIHDSVDFSRHIDYIHWNPVKHGHVIRVADWPYSTFHRYIRDGIYPQNWAGQGIAAAHADEFGE
jgi:putative transposase